MCVYIYGRIYSSVSDKCVAEIDAMGEWDLSFTMSIRSMYMQQSQTPFPLTVFRWNSKFNKIL